MVLRRKYLTKNGHSYEVQEGVKLIYRNQDSHSFWVRDWGARGLGFLKKGLRELSEMMKRVHVLIGVLVTWVCIFVKTH